MSVHFLLDENMPFALIELFERRGYRVSHLKQMNKGGIKNGEVYRVAEEGQQWIVTRDSDFKSYRKFITHDVPGIIVFALADTTTKNVLAVMNRFLEAHYEKLEKKNLIIIEEEGMRIYTVSR